MEILINNASIPRVPIVVTMCTPFMSGSKYINILRTTKCTYSENCFIKLLYYMLMVSLSMNLLKLPLEFFVRNVSVFVWDTIKKMLIVQIYRFTYNALYISGTSKYWYLQVATISGLHQLRLIQYGSFWDVVWS